MIHNTNTHRIKLSTVKNAHVKKGFMMTKQLNCAVIILLFHAGFATADTASDSAPSAKSTEATTSSIGNQLTKTQKLGLLRNIDAYQSDISDLESEEGVYGNALVEKLTSLGLSYQYLGQHNKAITVFKRAIHVNRVNDGLYSEGQVQILQRQIASHIALGQWKEVSKKYGYLYWLNSQNYGKNDPRMQPTFDQLSRWHLRAYSMRFGKDRIAITEHLITAHHFIERSIELLEQSESSPEREQKLIKELNELTVTNYLFATYQRGTAMRSNTGTVGDPEVRNAALLIDHYITRSFRSGKNALDRVINIYANSETAPRWKVAKAKVKMADWLFLFNKKSAAFDLYSEAYALLTESEENRSHLESTFGQPVALPKLDLIDSGQYAETESGFYDQSANYVLASFDVTPQGSAANIEIIDSKPEDNVSARSQVKRSLRVAKFRPRFVQGQPAFTEKMKLRVLSR